MGAEALLCTLGRLRLQAAQRYKAAEQVRRVALKGALPDNEDLPVVSRKRGRALLVAHPVRRDLWSPIRGVRAWPVASAAIVPLPEAAVNEHGKPVAREN